MALVAAAHPNLPLPRAGLGLLIALFLTLFGVFPARAGPGTTSFISLIDSDKSVYTPGAIPTVSLTLTNNTRSAYSGHVDGVLCSRLTAIGAVSSANVTALARGASTTVDLTVTSSLPTTDHVGYHFETGAFDAGDRGTVGCTGHTGFPLDRAMIGLDVSSDTIKFPRHGFLAHFDSGINPEAYVARWRRYRLSSILFYDMYYAAHQPYRSGAYLNIDGDPVSSTTVNGVLHAIHVAGMSAGFFDDAYLADTRFPSDDSGVRTAWGLFTTNCAPNCAYSDLANAHLDLPPPFQASNFLYMNPNDPRWRSYYFGRLAQVFANYAFDYWQIDTLGYTPIKYDTEGRQQDIGKTLAGYSCAAARALGRRVQINNVSGWEQSDVDLRSCGDNVWTERHPELGDMQSYFDIAWTAAGDRHYTSRVPVYPVYMNECAAIASVAGVCTRAGAGRTTFNGPAILLADEAFYIAGADHFELGDYSAACGGIAMANAEDYVFARLCPDVELQNAMYDIQNFSVAYENLLYDGAFLSNVPATITSGATGSATAAAGAVFLQVKRKPGFQFLHLLNLTNQHNNCARHGVAALCYQDLSGASIVTPTLLTNLAVKMYYFGAIAAGGTNPLYVISPEIEHGRPVALTYRMGADAGGTYVDFTVPRLTGYDAVVLETNTLETPGGGDYTINAANLIPMSGYNDAAAGVGADLLSVTDSISFCCALAAHYTGVAFGATGYTHFLINARAAFGGVAELHLDTRDGPLLASVTIPPSGFFSSYVAAIPLTAGTHDIYIAAAPGARRWQASFMAFY